MIASASLMLGIWEEGEACKREDGTAHALRGQRKGDQRCNELHCNASHFKRLGNLPARGNGRLQAVGGQHVHDRGATRASPTDEEDPMRLAKGNHDLGSGEDWRGLRDGAGRRSRSWLGGRRLWRGGLRARERLGLRGGRCSRRRIRSRGHSRRRGWRFSRSSWQPRGRARLVLVAAVGALGLLLLGRADGRRGRAHAWGSQLDLHHRRAGRGAR